MKILFHIFFLIPLWLHSFVLQEEVSRELASAGIHDEELKDRDLLDVAIIGGGQAGMSACLALWKQQIYNVSIFESAEQGFEGPWLTTARMKCLRSSKQSLLGPTLGFASLAFSGWYENAYGGWEELIKVPTRAWAEYLQWYQGVLNLPVKHGWRLLSIIPENEAFTLVFNGEKRVRARKIVLATGRDGLGGFEIPAFIRDIPKTRWFHTGEIIDPSHFFKRRICIIGAGASAFDVAAKALEEGAENVTMVMRRDKLPRANLLDLYSEWPTFFSISDAEKLLFFQNAWEIGAPPPSESIARLSKWENFKLMAQCCIEQLSCEEKVCVLTNNGSLETDLILLATGYAVDVSAVAALECFSDQILLWGNRFDDLSPKLCRFPYLGKYFEFLEKIPGSAPYLKNIYCFNYGAYLSHGRISGDIDQIGIGAERLAEGIALDLKTEKYSVSLSN
jgi:FAD-dependent urate hydroxylase